MKVSIIIPVYNVALYIERCIKSVMSQTYNGDIECILVNDASPDDSIDIAKRLIADYKGPIQFRILNHEQNRGLSATRNTGIDAATGDYLYFFDSDDEITPDCIEKLSRPVLNDPTIEMVDGCYTTITTDGNNDVVEIPHPRPQLEFTSRKAVRSFFFSRQNENKSTWNKLTSKKFILKNKLYFKEGVCWEDFLWHFQYNRYLSRLYIVPDITYKYHIRPKSIITGTPQERIRYFYGIIYEEIANGFTPEECAQEVKYLLNGFCHFYLRGQVPLEYKHVASIFLKVLKENHCIKDWLFLKTIILLSKIQFAGEIVKKIGAFLKNIGKHRNPNKA